MAEVASGGDVVAIGSVSRPGSETSRNSSRSRRHARVVLEAHARAGNRRVDDAAESHGSDADVVRGEHPAVAEVHGTQAIHPADIEPARFLGRR
jgi:hypothetical protein